jgi:hypothetical protein
MPHPTRQLILLPIKPSAVFHPTSNAASPRPPGRDSSHMYMVRYLKK